jgi:hypothetical protein
MEPEEALSGPSHRLGWLYLVPTAGQGLERATSALWEDSIFSRSSLAIAEAHSTRVPHQAESASTWSARPTAALASCSTRRGTTAELSQNLICRLYVLPALRRGQPYRDPASGWALVLPVQ